MSQCNPSYARSSSRTGSKQSPLRRQAFRPPQPSPRYNPARSSLTPESSQRQRADLSLTPRSGGGDPSPSLSFLSTEEDLLRSYSSRPRFGLQYYTRDPRPLSAVGS